MNEWRRHEKELQIKEEIFGSVIGHERSRLFNGPAGSNPGADMPLLVQTPQLFPHRASPLAHSRRR